MIYQWECCWMVSRSHGIWPKSVRCKINFRRSKIRCNAKKFKFKDKFRESFRPFAPSILHEDVDKWFDISVSSPYMLMVARKNKNKCVEIKNDNNLVGIERLNLRRSIIPAVTHVDYSARIQTVHKKTNPKYYKLLFKFKKLTSCPILVNTSFNVRGEPIVNTPEDAFKCFMATELDKLVIGNCYLDKKNQNNDIKIDYKRKFELD